MSLMCGTMLSEIPFARMPLIFKNSGMDFIIIDCEHGGFCERSLADIIIVAKLVGLSTIIRLPDNTRRNIIQYLDMGADGLLLPMTDDVAEIAQVAKYAKYMPLGERGVSTMRAHTLYNPGNIAEYTVQANHHTKIYAQIETANGLKNAERIIRFKGVDGLILGPNDLSFDVKCLFSGEKEPIVNAIKELGMLSALGTIGIITGDEEYLCTAKKCGYQLLCKGSELHILKSGAEKIINDLKNI